MSNWLAGGTSAFDVASRQYRMRFKPPMTFRRAMEKATSGTDNYYKSYVREEWTPMAIGVNQHTVEPVSALYVTQAPHLFDFGTFRLDAGYEVAYIVPRSQMGMFTITLTPKVNRIWVNLAIVNDRPRLTDTPPGSYLLYQTMLWMVEPPLVLRNIAMQAGTEVRIAASSFCDVNIMGPCGSDT